MMSNLIILKNIFNKALLHRKVKVLINADIYVDGIIIRISDDNIIIQLSKFNSKEISSKIKQCYLEKSNQFNITIDEALCYNFVEVV
jgi:hypothetical protein